VARMVLGLQRLAGRLAAGQGHEGMASELRGQRGEAAQFYAAALRLSRARDALGRAL